MRSILTIAGSDPSGGAGLQADLKVFASQGLAGLSAITAITVQDSAGVESVTRVDPGLLFAQIDAVLNDSRPGAVKIGLLPSAQSVHAVVRAIRRHGPPNVVLDPVLGSTGGVPFLDASGQQALLDDLVPLCVLVTPNLHEAALLTGMSVDTRSDRVQVCRSILGRGTQAALLKGGHLAGDPIDLLVDSTGLTEEFHGERIPTQHTHGTGCFLSSAIAARLAAGDTLRAAVVGARRLLKAIPGRLREHGWLPTSGRKVTAWR